MSFSFINFPLFRIETRFGEANFDEKFNVKLFKKSLG